MSIKNMCPIVANFLVLVSVPIDCSCDIGRDTECLATLKPMVLDCFVVPLVFRLIQSKHAIQVNVSAKHFSLIWFQHLQRERGLGFL